MRVVPSFRTDAALNICRANYRDYALHLGEVCSFSVETLDDLRRITRAIQRDLRD